MPLDFSSARWRKSTRSSDAGDMCVEIANLGPAVAVRDSTDPGGPKLAFSPDAWHLFTTHIKTGHLDSPHTP